ncbi:MAG TPA: tetratricopeptide repeat protein [Chitinophagaceae bacterium]|nr:tetratricopeptide repeat protein [Chitinophagaceae bacterium]
MFGIITALPHEYAAVKAILENPTEVQYEGGAGRRFTFGVIKSKHGGDHKIAVGLLPSMGNNPAAVAATLMLDQFKNDNLEAILMVGIAGGAPNPKNPAVHVRLGDIVVSNEGGVVQYDNKKITLSWTTGEAKTEVRYPPRPPSAKLLEACRIFMAEEFLKERNWISHIKSVQNILKDFGRPESSSDILYDNKGQIIPHPIDTSRIENEPKVHLGKIGSANSLLKNPELRDLLRDEYGIRANEMESSGIADATWMSGKEGYFVIRGICDYCDPSKNDDWQKYAALAAAAFTKGLIESMPSTILPSFYAGSDTQVEETILLPVEHNNFLSGIFVGRDNTIQSIIDNYINDPKEKNIALVEKGGIGKTAMAAAIAEELRKQPLSTERYVFMADLKNEKPSDVALRWLKYFGVNYDNSDEATRLNELARLISNTPSIIILDNCQDRGSAQKLFIQSPLVFSIITSRDRNTIPAEFKFADIKELDLEASFQLIKNIIGETRCNENLVAANKICNLCGGIPLALKIAGAELRNEVRWQDLDDYVKRLSKFRLDTLSPSNKSDESVRAAFDISYENLNQKEKTIFDSLGAFHGNKFSKEAVDVIHDFDSTPILESLANLSLISEFGKGIFGLHDLILLYAKEKFSLNISNNEWSNRLLSFYSDYLIKNKRNYLEIDFERKNILGLLQSGFPKSNPNLTSYFRVIQNIHPYLKDRGLWDELLEISNHAFKTFDDSPKEKAFIATWLLSWVLFQQGKFDEAFDIAKTGLDLYDKASDPEGKATAKRRIGMTLIELEKFEEAEDWLNQAKQEFETLKMPLKIGDTLCLLGLLERKKKNFDKTKAKEYLDDALKLVINDEKETSMVLYGIGRLNAVIGNNDEAIAAYSKSIEIDTKAGRRPGIAYNTFRIGQIEITQTGLKEAGIEKLERSKSIFASLGNQQRVKQIENILANNK